MMTGSVRTASLGALAHAAAVASVFGLVGYAISFATNLLAARQFVPAAFGQFSLAQTILGLAAVIAYFGIPAGVQRFVPYYQAKRAVPLLRGYLRFSLALPLAIAAGISLVLIIGAQTITDLFGFVPEFTTSIRLVAIALPFITVSAVFGPLLISQRRVMQDSIRYNVFEKLTFLLLLLCIIKLDLGIVWVVAAMTVSIIIACGYSVVSVARLQLPWHGKALLQSTEWLAFSVPLVLSGAFAIFIGWSDKIIIAAMLDAEAVGVYSVALSFAMLAGFFQSAFASLFLPTISRHHAKDDRDGILFFFRKLALWTLICSLPIVLFMVFYGEQLLFFFYGPAYRAGAAALAVLSFGLLINVSTGLNKDILLLHGKTRFIFVLNVCLAIVNVLGNIVLITYWGIVGAAVATAVTMALDNLISLGVALRYERLRFDGKRTLLVIASALIALMPSAYVMQLPLPAVARAGLVGILYVAVYALLLVGGRIVGDDERRVIMSSLRGFWRT